MDRSALSHTIAMRHFQNYVREMKMATMSDSEILVGLESMLTAGVVTMALFTRAPDPKRYAQEMIESITEAAHLRARAELERRQASTLEGE